MSGAEKIKFHSSDGITGESEVSTIQGMQGISLPEEMIEESNRHEPQSNWNLLSSILIRDPRKVFKMDELGQEIMGIAFPTILALGANFVTSLIHTALLRHLDPAEADAVEFSTAGFSQAINIITFALATITASFVAIENTPGKICANSAEVTTCSAERIHIPSASTALAVAGMLGVLLTSFLTVGAETLLDFMELKPGSLTLTYARRYLKLRFLGIPAILLSFAMQGIFLGLKDTRTPFYATVAGELTKIALDPVLTFVWQMSVSWVAVIHVISQYLIFVSLLWRLMKRVYILPPSLKAMHFHPFLKNGLLMVLRGIALVSCSSFANMLAVWLGSTSLDTFEICLKIWTISSLVAGGLAAAGQAILASAFAEKDHDKAIAATSRVLEMGFILGLGLAMIVAVGLIFGSRIFTKDVNVQHLIFVGVPFVAAAQPINALVVVFDGVVFGVSDFAFSAYSMVVVSIFSMASLFILSESLGFVGIWIALTIYMGLRILACIWRMKTGTWPWCFLAEGLFPQRLQTYLETLLR